MMRTMSISNFTKIDFLPHLLPNVGLTGMLHVEVAIHYFQWDLIISNFCECL